MPAARKVAVTIEEFAVPEKYAFPILCVSAIGSSLGLALVRQHACQEMRVTCDLLVNAERIVPSSHLRRPGYDVPPMIC
jgi:hypothetical protein